MQVHYVTCDTMSLTQSQASILTITRVGTYIPRTTYSGYIRDYFAACIDIIPFPLLILLITHTQELYYIFPNHTWFLFLSLVQLKVFLDKPSGFQPIGMVHQQGRVCVEMEAQMPFLQKWGSGGWRRGGPGMGCVTPRLALSCDVRSSLSSS